MNTDQIIDKLNIALGHRGMHKASATKATKLWALLPEEKRAELLTYMSAREIALVGVRSQFVR